MRWLYQNTALVTIILALSACIGSDLPDEQKLRSTLEAQIPAGTSISKAQQILNEHGIQNSYDWHAKRIQGIIRSENSQYVAISIHVLFGLDGTSKKIEVSKSYTGL